MENRTQRKGGAEKTWAKKRQAHQALAQNFAGGYGGASSSSEAAAGNINDGGGGRQVDEGKMRQRPAAAGASGGESELQVRNDELRSTWVKYESSLGVVYFRCAG